MKKYILSLNALVLAGLMLACSNSPQGYYDENAIANLDKLTETIGQLNALSVYLESETTENGIPHLSSSDVYIKGPSKMHIVTNNGESKKGFWMNGSQLSVFNFNTHQFQSVAAPPTIIETIDSAHRTFGVQFPAADFFYPTLTDDLIAHSDTIVMLENKTFNGEAYGQIRAVNSHNEIIITVDLSTNLPAMLEVYSIEDLEKTSYVAKFMDWKLNPEIADQIFTFSPPENAIETQLLKVKK